MITPVELMAEQKHFYNHQTRSGTGYELTQRLNQLREAFYNGDRNILLNRPAAVQAMTDLQSRIGPQPTEQEQPVKHNDSVIETAQRYRNEGSDHIAQRVLQPHGLTLDDLSPRAPNAALDERESGCLDQYQLKRNEAILKLRAKDGLSQSEAVAEFDGESKFPEVEGLETPHKEVMGTMDSELRRQVNLDHGFKSDRAFS